MKTSKYKRLLLAKEQDLVAALGRARSASQEPGDAPARDVGDESIYLQGKEDQLREVDIDRDLLNEVRDALRRIEHGEFGRCAVDGGPIEEKRLQAVPWTRYCLKHEQQRENGS